MRNPQGYAIVTDPEVRGGSLEYDTVTCAHCNHIGHVKPGERPEDLGGLCKSCMGLICSHCVTKNTCYSIDRLIEDIERNIVNEHTLGFYGLTR